MNSSTVFIYHNPMDGESRLVQADLKRKYGGKNDPERPPEPERGDVYVIIGLIVGAAVGGLLGSLVDFFGFFGLVGGAIVGGIIGVTIGEAVKKSRRKKKTR